MSQYADQRAHDTFWMTASERNKGTTANPLSAYDGERAIRAAVGLRDSREQIREPDDIQTALLAIRLYCERESLDFAALVAGIEA